MKIGQNYFDLHKLKKDLIIDFLPGIFYIYEKRGNDFHLTHWNLNHEKVTGYSSKELQGKTVFEFFYPDDFQVIKNGLAEIMLKGTVKQVNANLRLKNGGTLPFLFEGYKFVSNGKTCFLGVGLDVSDYMSTQKELENLRFTLNRKNRELFAFSEQNAELIRLKSELKKKFKVLKGLNSMEDVRKELNELENRINFESRKKELWDIFQLRFNEVHENFFINLRTKYPSLTNSEIKYLSYLKIKLSGFQIASLLNIGKDAIKKKRYRIRMKIGLSRTDVKLEEFVDRI
jgi:PAS domain S-box-containing protein